MGFARTPTAGRIAKAPALRARARGRWAAPARSSRTRRRYAEGLENAVERARRPRPLLSPAVPVSRDADGDARAVLLDLAERLRQPRPVRPQGVALVRELLCDGGGPLYYGAPGQLHVAASIALHALDADMQWTTPPHVDT